MGCAFGLSELLAALIASIQAEFSADLVARSTLLLADEEEQAIENITDPIFESQSTRQDVQYALERGWWEAARLLLYQQRLLMTQSAYQDKNGTALPKD